MEQLNFHHLHLFWVTAREGTITAASQRLQLSPSTVSTQIKCLEGQLGHALFARQGRNIVLTERGRVVKEYADDIFALGEELTEVLQSTTGGRHAYRLRVGVSNNLPKLVAYRLLSPTIHLVDFPVHLVCREDEAATLVADLGLNHLDLVLSDTPVGLAGELRTTSSLIGESEVEWFGTRALIEAWGRDLPSALDGAPVLLPGTGSNMRRLVEEWCEARQVRPHVVAEFADSALLKAFGQEGAGFFPAPAVVRSDIVRAYGVQSLGPLDGVVERFYAIAAPGRASNPAVRAVLEMASTLAESDRLIP